MVWRLDNYVAQLSFGTLAANIDLSKPECGLWQLSIGGVALPGAEVLALRIDPAEPAPQIQLLDCFARGSTLCARYQATHKAEGEEATTALALRMLWQPLVGADKSVADQPGDIGLELMILANCESWECWPRLEVRTRLPECETAASIEPAGPEALLCRLPGGKWSYSQMVHPLNDQGVRVAAYGQRGLEVIHTLFGNVMEKGVVWLAMVRGFFLPRQGDDKLAARRYAQFAATPPPLGD